MKMFFMHGYLLLPARNNVLLSRRESMVYWMLLEDHSVILVKVRINFYLWALNIHKLKVKLLTAIHNLANKYREEFKLPNLKLPFNNRQGFYFSIPHKDVQGKLPSKFIQVMV